MISRIVVDASVALAWIFDDESEPYADSILGSLTNRSIVVPGHWMLEVTNSMLMAERKGRIAQADIGRGFALLDALPIAVDSATSANAGTQTISLARTYSLTTYDAAYLELAIREGISLATLDSDLIGACKAAGVVLAPMV